MKLNPQIILGSLIVIIAILTLIVFTTANRPKSNLLLTASENKFKISFNIGANNQKYFSEVLEKFSLPPSVKSGFEFQLDATSSARLALITPAEAELNFSPNKIRYKGEISHELFPDELPIENLTFPKTTRLVVFAPNFKEFLNTKMNLPSELTTWINRTLINQGQYLVVGGQDSDFTIVFKSTNPDFESLKNLKQNGNSEPVYKEESEENITLHLLNLFADKDGKQPTLALFQIGQFIFLNSSQSAAQEMINAQKFPNLAIKFSALEKTKSASFAIYMDGSNDENFYNFILGRQKNYVNQLAKVKHFEFILKGKRFSGLINIE